MRNMPSVPRWLIVVFGLVIAVIIIGGSWFYWKEKQLLHQQANVQLTTISNLKVAAISKWRDERLADASDIMENPFFLGAIMPIMAAPQEEIAKQMLTRFRSLRDHDHYNNIMLVDDRGQVRLKLGDGPRQLHNECAQALGLAFRERRSVLSNIHLSEFDQTPYLIVVAPFFSKAGEASRPVAAVILQIDPRQFLFPLVESQPGNSRTAETLLVQRDGEAVLFLNNLRHRQNTALNLRIPLSQTDNPAVMMVLGKEGICYGKDYRGVPVLSVLKAIPNSPWFMVAKMDIQELLKEWNQRAVFILGLIATLLLIVIGMAVVVWQWIVNSSYQNLLKSQETLQISEDRNRALTQSANDAIITNDTAGNIVGWNPCAERMYGYSEAEIIGRPMSLIVAQRYHAQFQDDIVRLTTAEKSSNIGKIIEEVGVRKDGSEFPLELSLSTWGMGGNKYVTGIIRDISERKRREEELEESRQQFKVIFDSAIDGILLADAETTKFFLGNNKICQMLGYTQEEITSLSVTDIHPKEALHHVLEEFGKQLSGEIAVAEDLPIKRKDGSIFYADVSAGKLKLSSKLYNMGIFRDITERKQAEKSLRESETYNRSLIEHLPQRIFLKDRNSVYISCNTNYARDLGIDPGEIAGKDDYAFYSRELADMYRADDQAIMASNTLKDIEERYQVAGQEKWVHTAKVPYRDEAGNVIGVLGIFEDITERKKLVEKLLQSEKLSAVGQLAAGVAHEINNPLGIILGFAQALKSQVKFVESAPVALDFIEKEALRCKGLVQNLLLFSRASRTEQQEEIDINATIEEALSLVTAQSGITNIELVKDLEASLPKISANKIHIQQIVINLCNNAMDAMADKGKLTIQTKQDSRSHINGLNYIVLKISDTGNGIPKEIRSKIFDPFFTTKEVGKGTGLGLSLVYEIIHKHHGTIDVESEVGGGTTFTVYLPTHSAEAQKAA